MLNHAPGLQRIAAALVLIASLCMSPALPGAAAQDLPASGMGDLQSQAEAAANTVSWAMASGHPLLLSVEQDRPVLEAACHTALPARTQALVFEDFGVLVEWLPIPTRMADLYLRASVAGSYQNPGASAFADEIGLCMDSTILLQSAAARAIPIIFAERPEWREDAVRLEGLAIFAAGTHQTLLGAMETAAAAGVPPPWRHARLDTIILAAPHVASLLPSELCLSLHNYAHTRAIEGATAEESGEWQAVAEAFACAV